MPPKSCSDFDLRRKLAGTVKRTDSNATNNSNSPKSQSSVQSISEQRKQQVTDLGELTFSQKGEKL